MGLAIDSEGYFIDPQGNRLDETLQGDHQAWRAAIADARSEAEAHGAPTGDLPPPPAETSYVVVEQGDCLWSIAEEAGVDPVELSYSDNAQFENPDLIHPGDIVLVHRSPPGPAETDAAPPEDPALAAVETAAESGDRAAVMTQLSTYLGNVHAEDSAGKFRAVAEHDWGDASGVVMEELFNATAWNLENAPPLTGPTGGSAGQAFDRNVRDYLRGYLEALPDVCSIEPLGGRTAAADALMQHEWANAEYMTGQISMVRADLGIPE
ncbi:MAG TPA: hypothetical protein VFO41_17220 [Alphaproteobacteria bacterium]|nr:hypothetical protein [Alphaproteobacteria bacterium]